MFEYGVPYYTKFTAEIEIAFPKEYVSCQWCKYCVEDKYYRNRRICYITNRIIYDPEAGIDCGCPIAEVKEDES